jgi:3-hydroxyisobutyrate dehydrogenase-like beta-hydroxyacid dehydrogenase
METVGFIGVGAMGGAIAARMVERGVPVLAYDRNPTVLQGMVARGVSAAASTREVVDTCEIVFACLPTTDVCKSVALGADGVAGGRKVRIYVETSTFGGKTATEIAEGLAAKNITLLDTPVVGGVISLENGTLGVLSSGPKDAFERAKFALDAFAGRLFYLGENVGMAQAAKVMSNAVTYACVVATCEAVAMGLKAGLDMQTAVDIINQGSGANFFSQRMFPNFMLKGKYSGTGAIEIGSKDVKLFLEEAERLGMETPVARAISAIQKVVLESGPSGRDTMTYFHYFTDLAGLPRQG